MMWDVGQPFSPPPLGYGAGPPPSLHPPSGHKGYPYAPSHYPLPSHDAMPFQPLGMPSLAAPALARPPSYHYTNEYGPASAKRLPGPVSAPFPGGFAAHTGSAPPMTSQPPLFLSNHRLPMSSNSHTGTVGVPAPPFEIPMHHALHSGLPAHAQAQRPMSIPRALSPPQSETMAAMNGERTKQDGITATTPPPESGFKYSACTGKRKGLCIGINYAKSKQELFGCVNDAKAVRNFLTNHHGFRREDIVLLTDDASDPRSRPTRENVLDAMRWLVQDAHDDDSLFFHYSGHGAQIRDIDGDEIDGLDEVIYPVDYETAGHIVDDEIHAVMVSGLPTGCRLTALFDSCNSGSVLDLPYLYNSDGRVKRLQVSKKAMEFRRSTADVISWSGCKDGQASVDMYENGVAAGAMSYAFMLSVNDNPNHTYQSLLYEVRRILSEKYGQKPQLSSSHRIDTGLRFVI